MKKVVFLKRANHAPVVSDKNDEKYLSALDKGFDGKRTSWPLALLDVNYAESHIGSDGLMSICYVDLPREIIVNINESFEKVFISVNAILEKFLVELGLAVSEIVDDWSSFLNRRELRDLTEAFGEWKMLQSPYDYLDESNKVDETKIEKAFSMWCKEHHLEGFRKIKDGCLTRKDCATLVELSEHLNRFEVFPSEYFRKSCQCHGWRMNGLEFGEMCADGNKVLSMGSDGKCFVSGSV